METHPMAVDEFGNEIDDETGEAPQWRKKLEAEARAGREALARAETAERELAIRRAGIDLDSPTGKMFVDAYKGAADVEAVKAKAAEYGLTSTPQQSTPNQLTPEQEAAYAKMDQASQPPMGQPEESDQAYQRSREPEPLGCGRTAGPARQGQDRGGVRPHGRLDLPREGRRLGAARIDSGAWRQPSLTSHPSPLSQKA
jgi:hypothetical protein